jgi:hypothetical protein
MTWANKTKRTGIKGVKITTRMVTSKSEQRGNGLNKAISEFKIPEKCM